MVHYILTKFVTCLLQTQGKLVQAIQEQSFYRIGSNKKIQVDVRVISASNKNMTYAIESNILREDLFYRLSVAPIEYLH